MYHLVMSNWCQTWHVQPEGRVECCSFACQGNLTQYMATFRHLNYAFVLQYFVPAAEAAQDHDQQCINHVPHLHVSPHIYFQKE